MGKNFRFHQKTSLVFLSILIN
ncbi:hypothetical protein CY0110_16547 [Crocosphaera chwakensis CCY0110]|uniref:Uncharacterized protein n=1 Tax=Crocosphaera chwakensis CCY0110 TaxID=391612 RepID=A3IHZ1_9CHRO|nr:hypothetical protein CY0110_16547 [Crocosphaera chwakensis CCY0110]